MIYIIVIISLNLIVHNDLKTLEITSFEDKLIENKLRFVYFVINSQIGLNSGFFIFSIFNFLGIIKDLVSYFDEFYFLKLYFNSVFKVRFRYF